MKQIITIFFLSLGLSISNSGWLIAGELPLKPSKQSCSQNSLGIDEQLWGNNGQSGDRQALLQAIDRSLGYLNTPSAVKAYQNYPVPGITSAQVRRSLLRFRQLLISSRTPQEFQAAIEREFVFYQSVGTDKQGTVHFTGYFQPIYKASRTPTAEYRYPLYRQPTNFARWSKPHPTRVKLEGEDGLLGKKSPIAGSELVWLRDRLEAYLIQIQGSARLQLTDGKIMTVGYGGNTNYPYNSLGRELVKDGIFTLEELTLPLVLEYFRVNPQKLNNYIARNNRFIFFQETHGAPPIGSLGVPVTSDRSIATDKSLMPPGAIALICAPIPPIFPTLEREYPLSVRYVLDQDTGSAIKGAGRVDIFMGTGKKASDRAGMLNGTGKLYYLLLKK